MQIFGIDFTSAPSRRKPIVCIACQLKDKTLLVDRCLRLVSLVEFEAFLQRTGPWVAGFDFPFGQPRILIEHLGWPTSWAEYVQHVEMMGQHEFEETITRYRQSRPPGRKHHTRATDKLAKAVSPMMLHGVPVGKMFFQGAPRLLRSGVSILPCRPNDDHRIALEAYPALVARKWLDKRAYKSDDVRKQTAEKGGARRQLVHVLQSGQLQDRYGVSAKLSDDLVAQLSQDPTADSLDAFMAAIQAGWAFTQQAGGYGIPANCDPLEGWIIDPDLL